MSSGQRSFQSTQKRPICAQERWVRYRMVVNVKQLSGWSRRPRQWTATEITLAVTQSPSNAGYLVFFWLLCISTEPREHTEHMSRLKVQSSTPPKGATRRACARKVPYSIHRSNGEVSYVISLRSQSTKVSKSVNIRFTAAKPLHYHHKSHSQWASLDPFLALERLSTHPSPLQVAHYVLENSS